MALVRRRLWVWVITALLLVVPAGAINADEAEYPPDPPSGQASIGIEVQGRAQAKVIVAVGDGLEPGSTLQVDVTLGGPPSNQGPTEPSDPQASDGAASTQPRRSATGTVDDDGTSTAEISLPCEENRRANIVARGTPDPDIDSRGQVVATAQENLAEVPCTDPNAAVLADGASPPSVSDAGDVDEHDADASISAGASDATSSGTAAGLGALATTGTGIALLTAVAVALLLAGWLLLSRRRRA